MGILLMGILWMGMLLMGILWMGILWMAILWMAILWMEAPITCKILIKFCQTPSQHFDLVVVPLNMFTG